MFLHHPDFPVAILEVLAPQRLEGGPIKILGPDARAEKNLPPAAQEPVVQFIVFVSPQRLVIATDPLENLTRPGAKVDSIYVLLAVRVVEARSPRQGMAVCDATALPQRPVPRVSSARQRYRRRSLSAAMHSSRRSGPLWCARRRVDCLASCDSQCGIEAGCGDMGRVVDQAEAGCSDCIRWSNSGYHPSIDHRDDNLQLIFRVILRQHSAQASLDEAASLRIAITTETKGQPVSGRPSVRDPFVRPLASYVDLGLGWRGVPFKTSS